MSPSENPPITGLERFFIIVSVMCATLIQTLDTTIVNVALPHMQGTLSATPDEITWVLTSYLVASGIFMPLTGYFTDRWGQKKYLLFSIIGFTVASALCGVAESLTQIVLFRLLQGLFGAGLVPLSQVIMTQVFPKEDRGKAMAIWGIGVMIGPILGPTLGGYLTDVASWRWTFYVNVPIGIFALLLAWRVVPDSEKRSRNMDWWGLILIALAISGLQYTLDRGNQQDWYDADDICIATALFIVSTIVLVLYLFLRKGDTPAVFNFHIFKDRNFAVGSALIALCGLGTYGTMVIQPLMLEGILNYPVLTTGLVMAPRGIAGIIGMILAGKLVTIINQKCLILIGIAIGAVGTYVGTWYSEDITPFWVIWPLILQGMGVSLLFVPLSTMAYSTLPTAVHAEASGLFSLLRVLGSSIGLSVCITFFSRHSQMAWNQLGGFISPYNPALRSYLESLHLTLSDPQATAILGNELSNQSQLLSVVSVYALITWSFIVMIPLVFLMRDRKSND